MPTFRRAEVLRVEMTQQEVTDLLIAHVTSDIADGFTLDDGTSVDTGSYAFDGIINSPDGSGGAWLTFSSGIQQTTSTSEPMAPPPAPTPDPTPDPTEAVEIPPVDEVPVEEG